MPSSPTYFSPPSILADQPDREYQTTNVLGNFLIGASVSLVASCLSSLGVNLQASALQRNSHTTRSSSKDDVGEWEDEHVHHSGYGAISNEESSFASTSARAESPTRTEGTIRERRISSQPASSVPTSRQKAPSTTDDNDETDGFPEVWIDEIATKLSKSGGWSKDGLKGTLMKWQWYLGFSMYIISQLFGSVIALAFVSPVVLAPLGSASLIFNVLFARLFLGIRATGLAWVGTFLVVVGCAIVSTFGSGTAEERQTIDDLIRLFSRPAFIIYFSIQGTAVILVFAIIKYLEYGRGGVQNMIHSPETQPLVPRPSESRQSLASGKWIGVLYAALGGTVASQTLLLTKSGVELLIVSLFEIDNQIQGLFALGILITLCITAFLQLYSLNRGMHYSPPTIVIPVFYTFFTVFSLCNTLVYFDQLDDYAGPDLACVGMGILAIIGGVSLLARSGASGPPQPVHSRNSFREADEDHEVTAEDSAAAVIDVPSNGRTVGQHS